MRKGNEFKLPDVSNKLAHFVQMLYEQRTSFSYNNKNYTFNNTKHLQNTINKIRREEFAKTLKK